MGCLTAGRLQQLPSAEGASSHGSLLLASVGGVQDWGLPCTGSKAWQILIHDCSVTPLAMCMSPQITSRFWKFGPKLLTYKILRKYCLIRLCWYLVYQLLFIQDIVTDWGARGSGSKYIISISLFPLGKKLIGLVQLVLWLMQLKF